MSEAERDVAHVLEDHEWDHGVCACGWTPPSYRPVEEIDGCIADVVEAASEEHRQHVASEVVAALRSDPDEASTDA